MNRIVALLILFLGVQMAMAQHEYDDESPETEEEEFVGFEKEKKGTKDWVKRLRVGGNFGFGVSNYGVRFESSPLVSYQLIEDRLELGTGILYQFYREFNVGRETLVGSTNYARIYVWEGLFGQVRGIYARDKIVFDNGWSGRLNGGNLYLGGGYSMQAGDHIIMNIGVDISILENDLIPKRSIAPFFNFQYAF